MELLETIAQSNEIEKIIKESEEYLIIVSPYLKINSRLKPKLSDSFKRNKVNLILYRQNELNSEEKKWLDSFQNVQQIPIKNLHAKCYLNEKTALITSMNLYEYSQINNHEIGIKLTSDNNTIEIENLLKIIENIIKTDHSEFDFSYFISSEKVEYTMGKLYIELMKDYEFPNKPMVSDAAYVYMCRIATKLFKFDDDDFKYKESWNSQESNQISDALKRATPLTNKQYRHIKQEIIKVGVKKGKANA